MRVFILWINILAWDCTWFVQGAGTLGSCISWTLLWSDCRSIVTVWNNTCVMFRMLQRMCESFNANYSDEGEGFHLTSVMFGSPQMKEMKHTSMTRNSWRFRCFLIHFGNSSWREVMITCNKFFRGYLFGSIRITGVIVTTFFLSHWLPQCTYKNIYF